MATRDVASVASYVGPLIILGISMLFLFFLYSSRMTKFTLSKVGLNISGTLYGRTLSPSSLRTDEAEIVNMAKSDGLRAKWRRNGLGLPDYKLGWFTLRNGEKALLFITDMHRVVKVPTQEGFCLLLSPDNPEEFLQIVQEELK
jgi:hypothetical protein